LTGARCEPPWGVIAAVGGTLGPMAVEQAASETVRRPRTAARHLSALARAGSKLVVRIKW
jgi:hypothetical protein